MNSKFWNVGRVIVESAIVIALVVQITIGCIAPDSEAVAKYDGCVSQGEQTEMRLALEPRDTTGG